MALAVNGALQLDKVCRFSQETKVIKKAIEEIKKPERVVRSPAADLPDGIARPGWVTIQQCATLIGLNKFTLYHWVNEKRLTEDTGLRKLGKRWAVFKASVDSGRLG